MNLCILTWRKMGVTGLFAPCLRQEFVMTRLVAHMEWALEDRPGVDDLVEYESRLNYILPHYKDPVI